MMSEKETYVKPHDRKNPKKSGKHHVTGHTRKIPKSKSSRKIGGSHRWQDRNDLSEIRLDLYQFTNRPSRVGSGLDKYEKEYLEELDDYTPEGIEVEVVDEDNRSVIYIDYISSQLSKDEVEDFKSKVSEMSSYAYQKGHIMEGKILDALRDKCNNIVYNGNIDRNEVLE